MKSSSVCILFPPRLCASAVRPSSVIHPYRLSPRKHPHERKTTHPGHIRRPADRLVGPHAHHHDVRRRSGRCALRPIRDRLPHAGRGSDAHGRAVRPGLRFVHLRPGPRGGRLRRRGAVFRQSAAGHRRVRGPAGRQNRAWPGWPCPTRSAADACTTAFGRPSCFEIAWATKS